jgi:hypothetical protein
VAPVANEPKTRDAAPDEDTELENALGTIRARVSDSPEHLDAGISSDAPIIVELPDAL